MSSREQKTLKALKDKAFSMRANRIRKPVEYSKMENPLYVSLSQHHELRLSAGEEPVFQRHSLMNYKKSDHDLVKNSRNLPGYLYSGGKSENTQEKAFNFGVLDWNRLQNWKSNTKPFKKASCSSNNPAPERGSDRLSRSMNNDSPQMNTSCGERLPPGVRWARGKEVKVQNSESSYHHDEKQAEQMLTSERETLSLDSREHGSQHLTHSSANKMLSDDNIDHTDYYLPSAHQNVMFSLGYSPSSSSPEHSPTEFRKSCDSISTGVTETRLSDCFFAEDFHSSNSFSEVVHSYPECPDDDSTIGEDPFVKGRHSSSNRKFSYSLGKMARSFSFKESSSFSQLSSIYKSFKSGPLTIKASSNLPDYNWTKKNGTNKTRSTRFRQLLENTIHGKKQKSSNNVQTLLHLTIKNGIPFFKLLVDRSSGVLAAKITKLPSGKNDSSLTYAFYSIHDIKKKSGGWINQDSTNKSCGFGYELVGEMKISSSYHAEFSGPERDLFVVRESVLYSTDCTLNRELAAVIVKNTSDEKCGDIGSSNSIVVVLPGGVHSGQPSPLIDRWRSGGECDCGGWDTGCQLQVLNNDNKTIKIPNSSSSNRLDLCYQGGHENKHAFSLASLKDGIYSLKYDPSMSLLQAFAICVAVVSSQKFTHIFQVNHLPDANHFSKPLTCHEKLKSRTCVHDKIPPVSPVDRV